MKTCCTHVLSWIRPPPEFNKRLRGAQTGKRKEKKDGVSKASSETGNPISYVERSKKNPQKPK